jgi:hypothetical protein
VVSENKMTETLDAVICSYKFHDMVDQKWVCLTSPLKRDLKFGYANVNQPGQIPTTYFDAPLPFSVTPVQHPL